MSGDPGNVGKDEIKVPPKLLKKRVFSDFKDNTLAESLVDLKLRVIHQEIDRVLKQRQYSDATTFVNDARAGKIREAENDAIGMTNLLD